MNVSRTTEPLLEPVTLEDAKAHCRIVDFEDDDVYVTALISAARRAIEDATGRCLIDTVFTQTLRDWCGVVELMRGNARAVVSVKYDDADDVEQTVDSALYGVVPYGDGCARLAFFDAFTQPELVDRSFVDRVRIEFTAGYGALASAVPETLRQAVLYYVAHLYDNRSPVSIGVSVSEMPFTVKALCAPYKIFN